MASSPRILCRPAPAGARSYAKSPIAVHRRCACSGVKALRNTSPAKRQAAKLCYRFGPLTPSARSANLIAGDGTKNSFPAPNKEPPTNQKHDLTGKAPHKLVARRCAPIASSPRILCRPGTHRSPKLAMQKAPSQFIVAARAQAFLSVLRTSCTRSRNSSTSDDVLTTTAARPETRRNGRRSGRQAGERRLAAAAALPSGSGSSTPAKNPGLRRLHSLADALSSPI